MSLSFEISQKNFLKWRAKSPQKVAFRMPFHYFSPFISLLFTNPKVTNCPAIRYFFTYFPCSMVKLVYCEERGTEGLDYFAMMRGWGMCRQA